MDLAVIKTGGKQYLVSPGDKIKIDLSAPANISEAMTKASQAGKIKSKEIIFDKVLLLGKDGKLEIGKPLVKNAKIIGKILKQGKDKKVMVFKYKPKKRYKVKKGHRQAFTEVEIIKITHTP